jgi:dihydrofolate reductase
MRKLKIIEHISLDGVIQHSADDGDFPYSDWTAPYRTPAGRETILAVYGESFDLLLGRRTYDIWSGFWPKAPSSPMADGLNAATALPMKSCWSSIRSCWAQGSASLRREPRHAHSSSSARKQCRPAVLTRSSGL